jgi:hypothetical protein
MMVSQSDERNGDGGFTEFAGCRCIAAVRLTTRIILMTAMPDALCAFYPMTRPVAVTWFCRSR